MGAVYGTSNSEVINLFDGVTFGADTIWAYDGDDTISALGGDDDIKGGGGADAINGGAGADTAFYSDSTVGVTVSLLTGTGLGGTAQGDTLTNVENLSGSAYDDLLIGDDGDNVLSGSAGNDTLKGGGGADFLNGGSGNDTAAYNQSAAGVVVSLFLGGGAGGDAQGDSFIFIENVTGSGYVDFLIGTDGANTLSGLNGNDSLSGLGGADSLLGGNGNDELDGGNGDDVLRGGSGGDDLNGGAGNDTITYNDSPAAVFVDLSVGVGGGDAQGDDVSGIENVTASAYDDFVYADDQVNVLQGLNGDDVLAGFGGTDTLYGGNGNDILTGWGESDTLYGGNGDDMLYGGSAVGGSGADTMIGGLGDDFYAVDDWNDVVTENGGQGIDEVWTIVSYALTPGADVETLYATGGDAIDLTGNASGNIVRGNFGNNVINGGAGNDELIGGGGAGHDSFLFNTPLNGATNVDVLSDFTVSDTIVLENTIFGAFSAGDLAAERFVVGAAAQDASDCIIYNSATGALLYDADGTGDTAAVQFATLPVGLNLHHHDFLIV